jgi:hypothetical protein
MDRELAKYFFDQTSKAFAFLVNEYSFAPPQIQIDEKINFAYVTFFGKNLAIEFILDEREGDIDCKIVRVLNGKKPPYFAVDETGLRMREGLVSLLRRRGVKERLFEPVGQLDLRERIKVTLAAFASMLKKHGSEVLNDSPAALA